MEGDKEDHKRNGKRKDFHKTQEQVNRGGVELGGLVTLYAYDVDEDGRETTVKDAEDEWGLVHGLDASLNQRGRWNLPSLLQDLEDETWDLLRRGELGKRPLVVVAFEQNARRDRKGDVDAQIRERDALVKKGIRTDDVEEETSKEYKVIQGRSGKKVVEVGARSEHQKKENRRNECQRLEEATGVALHVGRLHYYIIDSPEYSVKTPKYRHGTCSCIRCQGWRGQHGDDDSPRFRKTKNLMEDQF